MEGDSLIFNQEEVCTTLNHLYVNIADETGINASNYDEHNHPSIEAIENNAHENGYNAFRFHPVKASDTLKVMNSLQVKKATGVHHLPVTIIQAGASVLWFLVTSIFNKCIAALSWLKWDQYLKRKKNYRPVSILPTSSKTY